MEKTAAHEFPSYTRAERQVDAAIHVVGVAAAPIASLWLLSQVSGVARTISLAVYCFGLVTMLSVSALYNLLPNIRFREFVRRADHAVIFVMIAGTYTPLVVNSLSHETGLYLGVFVWLAAAGGIWLVLVEPHRFQRLRLALYLLLGWVVIVVAVPLAESLGRNAFTLIVAGALVYSLGAIFHAVAGRFHNAIWHGLVLLAAALHFVAMACEFVP